MRHRPTSAHGVLVLGALAAFLGLGDLAFSANATGSCTGTFGEKNVR